MTPPPCRQPISSSSNQPLRQRAHLRRAVSLITCPQNWRSLSEAVPIVSRAIVFFTLAWNATRVKATKVHSYLADLLSILLTASHLFTFVYCNRETVMSRFLERAHTDVRVREHFMELVLSSTSCVAKPLSMSPLVKMVRYSQGRW